MTESGPAIPSPSSPVSVPPTVQPMGAKSTGRSWLFFAMATTVLWGVWGALIELPTFPATLAYVAWSLTMVPCALVALGLSGWKLNRDRRSIALGMAVGLSGAGGQLLLFQALKTGPAYIVFPIISLYPVVAIIMSVLLLRERAPRLHWLGIGLALPGIALLSYTDPSDQIVQGYAWLALASGTFIAWGVQAYVMKFAQEPDAGAQKEDANAAGMTAESVFFYMMVSGLLLAPIAIAMTDFSQSINYGAGGAGAVFAIQILNALGALTIVYAMRSGKAIIVAPMTALAPVITIVLSLIIHSVTPAAPNTAGMVLALIAIFLMAR